MRSDSKKKKQASRYSLSTRQVSVKKQKLECSVLSPLKVIELGEAGAIAHRKVDIVQC